MIKSYKFKIRRPSKRIVQSFEQTLDVCREIYNAGLQERRDAWKLNRINISYYEQQKQLTDLKQIREDLRQTHSTVLRSPLLRLDKTFQSFFNRCRKGGKVGFPRFKSNSRFNSFTFPEPKGFSLDGNRLKLSRIGSVRIHLSRKIEGKIKTCTIKREIDKWFVVFAVETVERVLPKTGEQVGIDVGIESFITLSNGTQVENQRSFEKIERKLRIAQRSVSRKVKGSNSRKRAWLNVKKLYQKTTNQRRDFLHKVSTDLIKRYDLIAIEKLNIEGLSKGFLSKSIKDVAWGVFFEMLRYKAESAGRKLIEVNPSRTSQTCICGEVVKKSLKVRHHKCLKCGYENHRDILSAIIILNRAVGQTVEELTYANRQSVSSKSTNS